MSGVSALSELIKTRMAERGITSDRQLARLTEGPARRDGVKPVTSASVSVYTSGSHGKPSERTLKLLAEALRLPLWKLRQAAEVPTGEPEPYTPPPEAARLDRRQRKAVDEMIRLLAAAPQPQETEGQDERASIEYLGTETTAIHPLEDAPRELPAERESPCGRGECDPPAG